ncbi:unnamed protein product [Meganyctiphanes norvegica]|uniref:DUF7064 domain-containing protein n=1 Tax=Meganyctiphanes norvegica TaxID=48144 RepID=A0AAV2PWX3_MEGNR
MRVFEIGDGLLAVSVGIIMVLLVEAVVAARSNTKKILSVYTTTNILYWPKVAIFYCLVSLRRWRASKNAATSGSGYGVKSRTTPEAMECPQTLSDHPKAIDAVYFCSGSPEGIYLVAATARRPKGVINGVLFIRIPGVGLLELPRMPDTILFGNDEEFSAEGLSLRCVKPMTEWQIKYTGPMKINGDPSTFHNVELDAVWTSRHRYFDFDVDMDVGALSRSMAREPWTSQYFKNLQEAHQTHYEQFGGIEGQVNIDGNTHKLTLDCMRDHSYGYKREWKLMHRYGLHMFTTEDGLQVNVGIVCQPATCSKLELGYVCKNGEVIPVSHVNLELWQHGEGGIPPSDYAFSFVAGGQEYFVEVSVLESPEFHIGWEWETRVLERMASFRLNGQRGWGIAEWEYRYHGGRPQTYIENDPAWTRDLIKD